VATALLFQPRRAYVAWVGDARSVLSRNGSPVVLNPAHSPSNPTELVRIAAVGGVVGSGGRLFHQLAVSRALGSFAHKLHSFECASSSPPGSQKDREVQLANPLSADPELATIELTDGDEFVVLASRSVWAAIGDAAVVRSVRKYLFNWLLSPADAAERLVKQAVAAGACRSAAATVVELDSAPSTPIFRRAGT